MPAPTWEKTPLDAHISLRWSLQPTLRQKCAAQRGMLASAIAEGFFKL